MAVHDNIGLRSTRGLGRNAWQIMRRHALCIPEDCTPGLPNMQRTLANTGGEGTFLCLHVSPPTLSLYSLNLILRVCTHIFITYSASLDCSVRKHFACCHAFFLSRFRLFKQIQYLSSPPPPSSILVLTGLAYNTWIISTTLDNKYCHT
jgi:hypothetical protein